MSATESRRRNLRLRAGLFGLLLAVGTVVAVFLIVQKGPGDAGSDNDRAAQTPNPSPVAPSAGPAAISNGPPAPAPMPQETAAARAAAAEVAARAKVAKLAAAAEDSGPAKPDDDSSTASLSAEQQSYVDQVGDTRRARGDAATATNTETSANAKP